MRDIRNFQVLILDRDSGIREGLSFQLQNLGLKTLCAASTLFALDILKYYPVSSVLMEDPRELPDGAILWNELRSRYAGLPVIILSASNSILEFLPEIDPPEILNKTAAPKEVRNLVLKSLLPATTIRKRIYERTEISQRVRWEPPQQNGFIPGTMTNISLKGAFITAGSLPQIDDVIELESYFETGALNLFSGLGIVRWIRPNLNGTPFRAGFGVEFALLNEEAEDILNLLCR